MNHLELLLRVHPRGAFDLDDGTTARAELNVQAQLLDDVWSQRVSLLDEALPDRSTALLDIWELTYGLNRLAGRTDEERQDRLVVHRQLLPDFRPDTIDEAAEALTTISCAVVEPGPFLCDDANSLCDTDGDVLDGAFVFFVTFDEATARTEGVDRAELQDLVGRMKPAHTVGLVQCDDFRCDDEFSLTDIDLLGA